MIEQQYVPFLEKVLTPRRLDHSLGVMQVMGELAEVYDLDREKALTIGILHDSAKDLPPEKQAELLVEGDIKTQYECENDYVYYLHAPVGAYLVQRELGISDEVVLDAIKTHTYYGNSKHFNNPHSWCMRFADLLEPTRNWNNEPLLLKGAQRLKEIVYAGRMAEGALLQTSVIIKFYKDKGVSVHPNMNHVKRELSAQLGVDDTFLVSLFAEDAG